MPFGACVTGSSKLRWPGYVAGCSGASAAASLKTIELLEAGLLQQSAEAAALLARGLATSCPMPGAISGHGLVLTISLDSKVDAARVVQHCLSQGLLLRWLSDNSFGLRPPLVAAVPEIESALRILGQVLKSILSCA
jgi:adenosylmethionine-8-amino-7-oxononanoate aminotransferase